MSRSAMATRSGWAIASLFGVVSLAAGILMPVPAVDAGGRTRSVDTPSSAGTPADPGVPAVAEAPPIDLFFKAAAPDEARAERAFATIAAGWKNCYAGMILDLARLQRDPRRLLSFLEERTGRRYGDDFRRWRWWIWDLECTPHPDYAEFKKVLYSAIDPRMGAFFAPGTRSLIRLDEVDWGGVRVNGIPPLSNPVHIPAAQARYLADDNIVFGIDLGGESRAYPKRILAWHEMARDRVGGVELTIVYCTLCGTVIPYGSEVGGQMRTFGTSGLLYRSNKLMFDEETMSLWSTTEGKPVIGPLAGSGLELTAWPVVTTTWREWRAMHPGTTVLSKATGHLRDYSEGAAYRDYFSTDDLMFEVPKRDDRRKNKLEVLAFPPRDSDPAVSALAISTDFLERNPVYQFQRGGVRLVVVTSPAGANRVYESADVRFARRLDAETVEDAEGGVWRVTEEALVAEAGEGPGETTERDSRTGTVAVGGGGNRPGGAGPGESGRATTSESAGAPGRLPRVPARRAFWFGWRAAYPDTLIVE